MMHYKRQTGLTDTEMMYKMLRHWNGHLLEMDVPVLAKDGSRAKMLPSVRGYKVRRQLHRLMSRLTEIEQRVRKLLSDRSEPSKQ